jgi:hypothetical protein
MKKENAPFVLDNAPEIKAGSYEAQALRLLDMQQDNSRELSAYGITGRAYSTLRKDVREKIENFNAERIKTVVYQKLSVGQISSPGTSEFGVSFLISEYPNNTNRVTHHFDVPMGMSRDGEVTPFKNPEDLQNVRDTNMVYAMVYNLRASRGNGMLPQLNANLTNIHDF